ncbi:MAG: branched-chain amino acid ABC transporter permease [SAR324 cluster bacterium]
MQFWITSLYNGISYGALLFLLSSGLSLIFGVMRIVNLAHGSYFLLGAYIAISVIQWTGSWLLAAPVAALAIAAVGLAMERLFVRRLGFDVLRQVLLTVGFALGFQQFALQVWGGDVLQIKLPVSLDWSLRAFGMFFPVYRAFMIALVAVVGAALWWVIEHTRAGAVIRATVDDAEMARLVGIDTSRVSMAVFGLGAGLAALGGVIGGGFVGVYPGLDSEVLPLAFAVVIIGGMGSLRGALAGSLIVGMMDNVGKALFPELAYFTLYAPMAVILAIKPSGLFGRD